MLKYVMKLGVKCSGANCLFKLCEAFDVTLYFWRGEPGYGKGNRSYISRTD